MSSLLRIAYQGARIYWRIRRPLTLGVKLLVVNEADELLLVRHTYQNGLHLPGGKVEKGESTLESGTRELFEEAGIQADILPADLFGVYANFSEFKNDHVHLFTVKKWKQLTPPDRKWEIEEVLFAPIKNLPPDITPATNRRVQEYLGLKERSVKW